MTSMFNVRTKRALLMTAIAAGASITGVAHADDSSMNPFTGESYAAFSGGYNRPAISNPRVDDAASAWRQANPGGLPERVFQSYSAPGEAWHLTTPTYSSTSVAVHDFRSTHPNGLDERELQALSSESSAWQLRATPGTVSFASDAATTVAQGPGTLSRRLAAFFDRGETTAQ